MAFRPDFRSTRDDLPVDYNNLPEGERARLMKERVRLLHVHAQYCWHADCEIVGNKNALTVLRDAIDEAIQKGKSETSVMCTDGEGYGVKIEMCDADWGSDKWERERLPYTAEYAKGTGT